MKRYRAVNGNMDPVTFEVTDDKLDVICKTDANGTVERTSLGLSDNVTWVVTQLRGVKVGLFQPRVIFRPETIIPNFELSTS